MTRTLPQHLLLLLFASIAPPIASQSQNTNTTSTNATSPSFQCPLTCLHNSTCALGDANFSQHPVYSHGAELGLHHNKSQNGYHCVCPQGYTGLNCGVVYESCADGASSHKCYHGGVCVPGAVDRYGNPTYHCDCTNAFVDGIHYAGTYCEHTQIVLCNETETNNSYFCVNDGVCNTVQNASTPQPMCICGDQYTGVHCEFNKSEVPPCNLQCLNSGICQIGIPDSVDWTAYNFSFCLCPPGYSGDQCQIDSTMCGTSTCLNGGTCVRHTTTPTPTCNCTTSKVFSGISYAGNFCQYEATDYCKDGHFCVNHGSCVADGNGYVQMRLCACIIVY